MPLFEYEAKTFDGRVVKGKLEATDEGAVIGVLRKQDYFPLKVRPFKQGTINMDISEMKKVSIKDISIFCRQFSVVITSGISILKGLEIVKQQTENKKLLKILNEVFEDVQKGKTLSAAMEKHKDFPDMLINMIQVGEASGTLDKILERMAAYYDKEYRLQQKIRQALTYPIVICIVAIAVVIFLVAKVIPTFISILTSAGSKSKLPLPTLIVIGFSNFVRYRWYVFVIIIAAIVLAFRYIGKTEDGRRNLDSIKLKLPLFGKVYRKIITSRFARTFGILMASGVPLLQSMSICASVVGNAVFKDVLEKSKEDIRRGISIGDTLSKSGMFPLMLTQMIKIGEESGSLDDVLAKTSDFYDGEVETATAQLTMMIEPLIIIILGVVVAFIILAVMLPMFDMYNAIGGM